jgi:hypothetical protein
MKEPSAKPYKGVIRNWAVEVISEDRLGLLRTLYGENLGFVIVGTADDHPQFGQERIRTSVVVKYNKKTGELETLNSRYKLDPRMDVV